MGETAPQRERQPPLSVIGSPGHDGDVEATSWTVDKLRKMANRKQNRQ